MDVWAPPLCCVELQQTGTWRTGVHRGASPHQQLLLIVCEGSLLCPRQSHLLQTWCTPGENQSIFSHVSENMTEEGFSDAQLYV